MPFSYEPSLIRAQISGEFRLPRYLKQLHCQGFVVMTGASTLPCVALGG